MKAYEIEFKEGNVYRTIDNCTEWKVKNFTLVTTFPYNTSETDIVDHYTLNGIMKLEFEEAVFWRGKIVEWRR